MKKMVWLVAIIIFSLSYQPTAVGALDLLKNSEEGAVSEVKAKEGSATQKAVEEPSGARKDVITLTEPSPDGSIPPGAQVYVVKPGDTLWRISSVFWGKPFSWPKMWQQNNPEVTNPHLIYPGDRIMLTAGGELVILPRNKPLGTDVSGQIPINEPPPEQAVEDALKYFSKQREYGFVSSPKLDDAQGYVIEEKMDKKTMISENDDVYIRMQMPDRFQVGGLTTVAQILDPVYHPISKAKLGHLVRYSATIQVRKIQDTKVAEGRVVNSIWDFQNNDQLVPYVKPPSEIRVTQAPAGLRGHVMVALDQKLQALARYQLVLIDLGRKDGVGEGNVFEAIWPVKRFQGPDMGDEKKKDEYSIEEKVVAELLVVETREHEAMCIIISSIRDIAPGDVIRAREPKSKTQASLP